MGVSLLLLPLLLLLLNSLRLRQRRCQAARRAARAILRACWNNLALHKLPQWLAGRSSLSFQAAAALIARGGSGGSGDAQEPPARRWSDVALRRQQCCREIM